MVQVNMLAAVQQRAPRLILPSFSERDTLAIFFKYLEAKGLHLTRSTLAMEARHTGLAPDLEKLAGTQVLPCPLPPEKCKVHSEVVIGQPEDKAKLQISFLDLEMS